MIPLPETVPLPLRLLGARWRSGRRTFNMRWGELTLGSRGFAFGLYLFRDDTARGGHFSFHLHLLWISAFLNLPFLRRWARPPHERLESWSVSSDPDSGVHLNWGRRVKIWRVPWRNWVQTDHEVMRPGGSWAPYVGIWEERGRGVMRSDGTPAFVEKDPDGRMTFSESYRYVLRSGEVQHRVAAFHVERRKRTLKLLRWLPWRRVSYAIDVKFSGEVGERTGSWKGGVIGCSYGLLPGELPLEALRRMERDRRFD